MFKHEILSGLMARAYTNALRSPDPSSQNGAVLVLPTNDQPTVISDGYNHFYQGIPPEVEDRDKKLQRIEHAERDAIYKADRPRDAVMVCPWAACCDCARAIIGSGIVALIYHRERYTLTDARWIGQVNEALGWIKDSGIGVWEFSGRVLGAREPILVSGRLWNPATCEYVEG